MPKKLAITVAGAVSLGSYEAGVMWEILDAISQHNFTATDEDRILIDVLTGASAGGMTAIILAQKLAYSANEFKGPYDNPLYKTWVTDIKLADLQRPGKNEPALNSIFSSDLIDRISREALLTRYDSSPVRPAKAHPAVGDQIRVGVALTNLNGVAYGYKVEPTGEFIYIDHSDQLTRCVQGAKTDNAAFWEPLRQAAVACGAFPFAFRAQDVARSANNETDDFPSANLKAWTKDPVNFTYSDGGILQNQPLGMAKNLVDLNDKHADQDSRFYLFVSPHAKDPSPENTFCASTLTYLPMIEHLLEVILTQSGFQDWITARQINEQIELLDARADELCKVIQSSRDLDDQDPAKVDTTALQKTATTLLALFYPLPDREHVSPGTLIPEKLSDAQIRISTQYSTEMKTLDEQLSPVAANAFRDSVLAFETAAGLGARDYMTIYGLIASNSELAGGGLQAFLGFFDQRFRDHDYDIGRSHARELLESTFFGSDGQLGPIRYNPAPINLIEHNLDGLTLQRLPPEDLDAFKAGLHKRSEQVLKELWGPVPAFLAHIPVDLVIDSVLNQLIHKSSRSQSAAHSD